jgi:hypothetical protein
MTNYVAGHAFSDSSNGRRCMSVDANGKICFCSWLNIKDACEADLGKTGIAHTGLLNDSELKSIIAEREREIETVWLAISDAASAGSR